MDIQSLLNQPTKPSMPDGRLKSNKHTAERLERDLQCFAMHCNGLSGRAIQEAVGYRNLRSAQLAIERGRKIALERGVDGEKVAIKIQAIFDQMTGLLGKQLQHQAVNGVTETITTTPDGRTIRHRPGIDNKLVGELGRSLIRWAEFNQLMDRTTETTDVSTNVIFVQPQADGATWDQHQQPIDATSGHGSGHASSDSDDSAPASPATIEVSADDPLPIKQLAADQPDTEPEHEPVAPSAPASAAKVSAPRQRSRVINK